ncbi:MAG: hypothetical protein P4N59_05305 [Negativicutes bacterium]|nr:hypothetical protein [Negativicutes bacterium]
MFKETPDRIKSIQEPKAQIVIHELESGEEWFCFWLMRVKAVNLMEHCQRSLLGQRIQIHNHKRQKVIRLRVADLALDSDGPQIYYLCGVTADFNYAGNFHLPFVRAIGKTIDVDRKGVRVVIENAVELPIPVHRDNDHPMAEKYEYRTCRNWQFAYNMVREGLLVDKGNQPQRQRQFEFIK